MEHGTLASYRRKCRCDKCRAANAEYHKSWRDKNSEKNKAYKRDWQTARRSLLRSEILTVLGDKCSSCGSTSALEIDHIHGGGATHRQIIKKMSYLSYVQDIRNQVCGGSDLYQLLCRPCHQTKSKGTKCQINQ